MMKKIFVAGHNGMVGSAIIRELKSQGFQNLITRTRQQLDLFDNVMVRDFFLYEKPDYVFVAAARVGGIKANSETPGNFIFENLLIQNNVIGASLESGVRNLCFLGSSCIYPRDCKQPIKEEYLLQGPLEATNEPYAIAKIAGLKLCEAFNRQFHTNYLTLMPTNLYGPNDNFDLVTSHMVPALIRKAHESKISKNASMEVWGTGSPRRDLLHVNDLANACVHFMGNKPNKPVVNIGSGYDLSIRQIAELIADVVGFRGTLTFNTTMPDGTPKKLLDTTLASSCGWSPKIPLEQGILDTYKHFKMSIA